MNIVSQNGGCMVDLSHRDSSCTCHGVQVDDGSGEDIVSDLV